MPSNPAACRRKSCGLQRSIRPERQHEPQRSSRHWNYSLTEHVQADFLGFLPRLVLGDASVISLVHFLDIFYYQFWTICVQAVLITRLKDNVVTVAEGERRGDMSAVHITGVLLHNPKGQQITFFLTRWQWCFRLLLWEREQLVRNKCCTSLRTLRTFPQPLLASAFLQPSHLCF